MLRVAFYSAGFLWCFACFCQIRHSCLRMMVQNCLNFFSTCRTGSVFQKICNCLCSIETRLEILSRPKAPKILQELLRNSRELPSPRPTKLLKKNKRFQKIPKDSKRFQKVPKDSKRFQKILSHILKDSKWVLFTYLVGKKWSWVGCQKRYKIVCPKIGLLTLDYIPNR